MAPHWKCGSGQPVAGSNPALSATLARRLDADTGVGRSGPRSAPTVGPMARGASPRASGGLCARSGSPRRLRRDARTPRRRLHSGRTVSTPRAGEPTVRASLLSFRSRARRGTSGALNLQSAPAGLNSHPRSPYSNATVSSDVEDRVPRSGDSRTVSGPEGSSTKRISSGAAERPGPSRSFRRARDHGGRRWVHGISSSPTPGS